MASTPARSYPEGQQSGPVLLCDDGSPDAAAAVTAAAALLSGRQAIALHVWLPPSAAIGALSGFQIVAIPPEWNDQMSQDADELARQAADRATQAGFEARPLAVEAVGPTWEVIIELAREYNAAVIVLGARGLSGIKHALLGSVSEKVVRHADRPVLVLHPRPGDLPAEAAPAAGTVAGGST